MRALIVVTRRTLENPAKQGEMNNDGTSSTMEYIEYETNRKKNIPRI